MNNVSSLNKFKSQKEGLGDGSEGRGCLLPRLGPTWMKEKPEPLHVIQSLPPPILNKCESWKVVDAQLSGRAPVWHMDPPYR